MDGEAAPSSSIYLKSTAADRARRSEEGEGRPLLAAARPGRAHAVLCCRSESGSIVLAEQRCKPAPEIRRSVAEEVVELARERAGWQCNRLQCTTLQLAIVLPIAPLRFLAGSRSLPGR